MIIPSIDIIDGKAVQLVGGREKVLDAGDPKPIAERFALAGEIAVVDLDAALGKGSNEAVIKELVKIAPCRVGGGIRDVEAAISWLDAGAAKVVLGTAATPEVLSKLPRERVIAALDAVHGEVVVEGWRTKTGANVIDRIAELEEYVSGFLVTFVEREGRLQGVALDKIKELTEATKLRLTIAGGVTTAEDVASIDALGADAQVGMALYTGKLPLADALVAPIKSDRPDGLWPTVVCDEHGIALGLAWSDRKSVRESVNTGRGAYCSRSRGLWVKGETSGATQDLLRIALDCDRDALRFTVRQHGKGFCHENTRTCWGEDRGLTKLYRTILTRKHNAPEESYTKRLFEDEELLNAKLTEEVKELTTAVSPSDVSWEAADVFYFTLVKMAKAGVTLADIEEELQKRANRVSRRPGDAKIS